MRPAIPRLLITASTLVAFARCTPATPDDLPLQVTVALPDGQRFDHAGVAATLVDPVLAAADRPLIVNGQLAVDPGALFDDVVDAELVLAPGRGSVRLTGRGHRLHVTADDVVLFDLDHDVDRGMLAFATPAGDLAITVAWAADAAARRAYLGSLTLAVATGAELPALPELTTSQLGFWQCLRKIFKIGAGASIAIDVAISYWEYTSAIECRERGSARCYSSCAAAARTNGLRLTSASATCDGSTSRCECQFERPGGNVAAVDPATCSTTTSDPFPCPAGFEAGATCAEETTCCAGPTPTPTPTPTPSPTPTPTPTPTPSPTPTPTPTPTPSPAP